VHGSYTTTIRGGVLLRRLDIQWTHFNCLLCIDCVRRGLAVDTRTRDRKVPGSIPGVARSVVETLVWPHFKHIPFRSTRD